MNPNTRAPWTLRVCAFIAFAVDFILILLDANQPKLIALLVPLGLALWVFSTVIPPI